MSCSASFERICCEDIKNFQNLSADTVLSDLKTIPRKNPFNIEFRRVKIEKPFDGNPSSASFEKMDLRTFRKTLDCMNRSTSPFEFSQCQQIHDQSAISSLMNKLTS